MNGLNEQQRDAVLCNADIVYVNAGPGTGKTHMLTSKLIEYIRSADTPPKIVALSYTNTAARQLGDRFEQQLEKSGISGKFDFFNGTIHSFCHRMLKAYNQALSRLYDYVILDEEELQELAQDIKDNCSVDVSLKQVLACMRSEKRDMPEDLFNEVARVKEVYKVISMQDILARFAKALDEDEGFRKWIAKQVTVVAIDEAQDLTELYYSIIDRMIAIIPGLKVFLVGDPRQNIFEFSGGSYRNLDEFLSRHPSHVTKDLTISYRCPQPIADYVNTFRFIDCDNLQLRSRSGSEGSLTVRRAQSESHEADIVLNQALEKETLNTCAVLCNNLRYVEPLINRLCELGLPYKVFGGRRLVKRHVRFLNHVLRIVDSDNAYSIRKVAEYSGIDLMENGLRRKSRFYSSELGALIAEIRDSCKLSPFPVLMEQILERIMRDPSDDKAVTEDYDLLKALSFHYETAADYLLAFVTDKDRFAPFFLSDYRECAVDTSKDFLTISTIHSAKGLEWDNVYVMGLSESVFPNAYFSEGLSEEEKRAFFNGQWKLMYVAATRAKESLMLTYSSSITRKGFIFQKQPSRFLRNLIDKEERASTSYRSCRADPGRPFAR